MATPKPSEQCVGGADLSAPTEPVRKFVEREEVLSSYPCSTELLNGRDYREQYNGPQLDTNISEDPSEQAPLLEEGHLATSSQHHDAEQYDPDSALQQKVSTVGSSQTQGTNETLTGFIEVVTKAATELCTAKEAEVSEVKRQYEQCHTQVIEYYEGEIERLKTEIEHLESENKLIDSSHKLEIDHLKKSHKRETASMQEAMQSQAQQLRTSETVRKKKEEELAELRSKYHEKLMECKDLRAQLAEKEGELSELESRITEAEREAEVTTASPKVRPRVRRQSKRVALKEAQGMLQTFQEIRNLMHQLCEGRDEQEFIHIRKQLQKKITDLKASARCRKSDSWPPSN